MSEAWRQWEGEVVEGRFRLREFLGASDHSAVFLTECGQPAEKVALKFLEANPATVRLQLLRWERASKLSHRHLIRVLQAGLCQLGSVNMLYVVSELADDNLTQILPNRPLTSSEVQHLLRSVLDVLSYLHAQGLVLGRLKPRNIMAVKEELKIASDGICTIGEKPIGMVQPGIYDPPEILTSGFSPAGDLWSVGITLMEALTQKPYAVEGIRRGDPALAKTVPGPYLEIARQCLRLDPQRRWTVADIAARLLPAPPPEKRHARRYLLLGAVALAALTVWFARPKLLTYRPAVLLPAQRDLKAREEPRRETPVTVSAAKLPEEAANSKQTPAAARPAEATTASAPMPGVALPAKPALQEPGAVREQVMPQVPAKSRETIEGKVRVAVAVSVDASGKVTHATLDSAGPSHYFAHLALAASEKWTFTAPRSAGEAVPSEWLLRYEFSNKDTSVRSTQVSPPVKYASLNR
jgi:TonB family protein